ncbi:reverse transcriptase [Gossypium australe]|uniref:Reverse transcriptase n=1 Tax=Gossypium australe TaxID=47621 RepID=A0A5B6X6D9_9ROSI|nr:reverse transcriptase [Gossypium australe]
MESVRLKCGFENGIDVGAKGNPLISLKSFSSFHIDVVVHDVECDTTWRLTSFYGNPEEKNRRESWELLRRLGQDQRTPWVVLGDFNEIVSSLEKKGGRLRADRQMHDFRMALENCGLNDLGYTGRERLDRGVVTLSWINIYPNYQVEHLNHSFSDHYSILLDTFGNQRKNTSSDAFQFEASWCLDNSLEGAIRISWGGTTGSIPNKLKGLGQHL